MRLKTFMVLCLLLVAVTSQAASDHRETDAMHQLNVARLQIDTGLFDPAKQQAIQVYMDDTASKAEKSYALYLLGLSLYRQSREKEPQNIPWEMLKIEFPDSLHALSVRLLTDREKTEATLDSRDMPAAKLFALGEWYELTADLRGPVQTRSLRDLHWLELIEDYPESTEAEWARSIMPVSD